MAQELYERVRRYLSDYMRERPMEFAGNDGQFTIAYGPALITHVLADHGHLPREGESMEECLARFFRGKRVFEVGCRHGGILKFLKGHKAVVGGNTDERAPQVRSELGRGSTIVEARAEELPGIGDVERFKPDIVLNGGLFYDRSTLDTDKAVDSFREFLRRGARVYLMPSRFGLPSMLERRHWDAFKRLAEVREHEFANRGRRDKTHALRLR